MLDEIEKIINKLQSMPHISTKIRMNEKWLQDQIDNGLILKDTYKKQGNNFFAGIPVEITDGIETYEFAYSN